MLNHMEVAFRLVEIEADVLNAKAAAVLYRKSEQHTPQENVVLRARLLALRQRVNKLCDEILSGDETTLFLAD